MSDFEDNLEKYFSLIDIPLLLYYIFFETVNCSTDNYNNVVFFRFQNRNEMIEWLKNGEKYTTVSINFLNFTSNSVPIKYKETVKKCKEGPNRLCIIITCPYDEHKEMWCSVITINKIFDIELFDDLKIQYAKHISTLDLNLD